MWSSDIARVRINRGKVPARGQPNRENEHFLSPFGPENLVSPDGFGNPAPRQPADLHIQTECGASLRDPPDFRGGINLFI